MRKKLALSAVSILFTLLLAEAALRTLSIGAVSRGSDWFAGGNHPRFLFQPDRSSGYTLRPDFAGQEVSRGHEFSVPVAINGQGWRIQPHTAPPPVEILAVGDSMTFGEGVAAGATYSAVIEEALGARVCNAGVPGYSSAQMLGRLRRFLPVLHPRMVVMTLSPTWDRQRCATPFVYKDGYIVGREYADRLLLLDGNLYLRETRLPVLGTATAYAERYSNLMRLALPALAKAGHRLLQRPRAEEPSAVAIEPTARNLKAGERLASQAGARFLALFVDDRGDDFERDRKALEARLAALGVPWLAVDEILPHTNWNKFSYPIDGHWNASGHQRVGEALAARIKPLLAAR